jgi:hypothetical protein
MLLYPEEKAALKNFGVQHFNINETASIICRCLLCDGQIDIELDKEYISLFEPEEEVVLSKHINEFLDRLVKAITQGTLKADIVIKDLEENIIKEETYLDFDEVYNWLKERKVKLGELYYDEYVSFIENILGKIQDCIEAEKIKKKNPDIRNNAKIFDENRVALLLSENLHLKTKLQEKNSKNLNHFPEKKLNPKRRDSLHKMVLVMAIEKYRYNPEASKNSSTNNIEDALLKPLYLES